MKLNILNNTFQKTMDIYLEPFVGGGSVLFHLNPNFAVITDVYQDLIDFYEMVKAGKGHKIHEFMKEDPNEEEVYYKIRDKMKLSSKLDNAKRFFYLKKTCFRGMLRYNQAGKFNIPFRRYKKINYSVLENACYEKLLKKTEILQKDFHYMFDNYNSKSNLMFLDPPYDSEFTNYEYCVFGKNEHEKLAENFKSIKIKCLLVVGKTDFIEELYQD